MADNTLLNLGVGGDTIATDDIGGVKHQLVKVEWGVADTATPVSAANPMPVVQTGTLNVGTVSTVTAVTGITNALPAGANTIGAVNIAAAQTLATVTTVGTVSAVTAVGTITPGTAATSLGKAEDAVHTTGDVGVLALGVSRAANTTLVSADGDYAPFQVDASGNLKVAIISGAGSGGTALADNATFTRGTTSATPIAGVVETSAPTLTNGNAGTLSLTTAGAVRVSVASGGIAGVIEDVASAGAEEGILGMTIRQDTIASTTSADGDFQNQKTNSVGALYTSLSHVGANAVLTGNGTAGTGAQRVTIASDNTAFPVIVPAATTGGYTPVSTVSAASTNATSLKASAGTVGAVTVTNINAAMRYLKFYNKASAPTVGTDTPVYVIPLPGNTAGAGATISFDKGLNFSTGIAWALTTGPTVADTGAVAVSEIIVSIGYI